MLPEIGQSIIYKSFLDPKEAADVFEREMFFEMEKWYSVSQVLGYRSTTQVKKNSALDSIGDQLGGGAGKLIGTPAQDWMTSKKKSRFHFELKSAVMKYLKKCFGTQ